VACLQGCVLVTKAFNFVKNAHRSELDARKASRFLARSNCSGIRIGFLGLHGDCGVIRIFVNQKLYNLILLINAPPMNCCGHARWEACDFCNVRARLCH
jgi:hypothetical protein